MEQPTMCSTWHLDMVRGESSGIQLLLIAKQAWEVNIHCEKTETSASIVGNLTLKLE